MGDKAKNRENTITPGRIETPVEGFMGNITTSAPFGQKYGDHKTPGSGGAPISTGGRGGASASGVHSSFQSPTAPKKGDG